MATSEPRSETEIRAGLAVWQSRRQLPGEDVGPVEHPPTVAALRLLADVEPLLDALSAALVAKAELEQENANLRESAETAVFAANNVAESYGIERDRRENANLYADAIRHDLAAALAAKEAAEQRIKDAFAVVSEGQRLAFDHLESSGATRIQHEERTPEQQAMVSLYSCIHDGVKRLAGRGDLELPTLDEAKVLVVEYRQAIADVRARAKRAEAQVRAVEALRNSLQPDDTIETDWVARHIDIALASVALPGPQGSRCEHGQDGAHRIGVPAHQSPWCPGPEKEV